MMLERESTPQKRSDPGFRARGNRRGSSVFAVLAGVAMVCTGATAAALAGSHATAVASTASTCVLLPSAPSSPPPSPSQTASGGTKGSGSTVPVSSTPNSTPTDLCVTMAADASSVNSGQNALYSITVSPKSGVADDVTVQISAYASSGSAPAPAFTVCGDGDGTAVCTLGTLHSGQSSQMQGQIAIPSKAAAGEVFTLSAKVTGAAPHATAPGSVTDSASVMAVAPKPSKSSSPSPTSGHHHSASGSGHHSGNGSGSGKGSGSGNGSGNTGSTGTTGNTDPLAGLPPLSTSGSTTPLGSNNPGGLFPTITPSSGPTPTPGTSTTGSKTKQPYKSSTVADVVPLNHGLLNGQVAGLIVLGLGIALVFARVSLRKPKGTETKS